MLERLIESLTGPGLRSSPKPTPTTPSSAKPTPVTTLTATLTTSLATPKPAPTISGKPSPIATPTSGASHPQFSINFQDGAGIRHYESHRDLVAAIRTRFGPGEFTVRLDVFGDGETVWLRMRGSDFYVTGMNLSADDNASYLNQPGWIALNERTEMRYPEESTAQISPGSIHGAMQTLRSGARGEDIRNVPLPIIAFVVAEAARFAIIEYVTDAALNFTVGTNAQNAIKWNDYKPLLNAWSDISQRVFNETKRPALSMLTVWFWATNNGPFSDLVNGQQNEPTGTFFEDLYNLLQSLGYHAELPTTPTPTSTTPPTPTASRTPPQR